MTRPFLLIAFAIINIQKLIVATWSCSKKQTATQTGRDTFKSLHHALKNATNCPCALPFVPPSCLQKRIWLEILQALTKHAQQLLKWFIASCFSSMWSASQLILSFAAVAKSMQTPQIDASGLLTTPILVSCNQTLLVIAIGMTNLDSAALNIFQWLCAKEVVFTWKQRATFIYTMGIWLLMGLASHSL